MKKKFNPGYLGLLAIPLAGLGIVGSVAFASPKPAQTAPTAVQTTHQATAAVDAPEANDTPDAVGDTGTEVGEKADGPDTDANEGPDAPEANDAPDAPGSK